MKQNFFVTALVIISAICQTNAQSQVPNLTIFSVCLMGVEEIRMDKNITEEKIL